MTSESTDTATLRGAETRTSVLITISTPGENTPICRLGNSEEILGDATVRELIQRVISPNSLFSVGVPMSQLQAETPTALAIGELLSADCCEVVSRAGGEAQDHPVGLDQPVRAVAREQVGTQGSRFLNVTLSVCSAPEAATPSGEDRREVRVPLGTAIEEPAAELEPTAKPPAAEQAARELPAPEPIAALPSETSAEASAVVASAAVEPAERETPRAPLRAASQSGNGIVAIVADQIKDEPKRAKPKPERTEYLRKSDWLRAQFLPEVEALDFSGLFVGNLGMGIREENTRRNVVMADPSRVTDVLLRANGYRRSGDHAKALIGYQELVDIDPGNADFRFLLGKTLLELGQQEDAAAALQRAKELGHEGAAKELEQLGHSGHRSRKPLGFLRFWKQ